MFEAVGLDRDLVDRYFAGTPSAVGGVGLARARPRGARAPRPRLPAGRTAAACPSTSRTGCCPPPTRSCCPRAASTPGGATASATPGTRRRSPRLQQAVGARNGDAAAPSATRSSRRRVDEENGALAMLRGLLELRPAGDPIPIDEVEPVDGDPQALHHRRHEPRRARPRGPRDARRGDEPDRRDVELRRGRRGHPPLHARPQRRPAPLADQAGRLGPLRRHRPLPLLAPTRSRSRSRRARSPARAASCPATRSTPTSPSCASRPPASA